MKIAPCLLPPGAVVRTIHPRSERVLRERKESCDGWWVDLTSGEDSGGLADHVLDTDYVVIELPDTATSTDAVMARGALAFIDLLLAEDVFAGDRDDRPESPRDLAAAWRDAVLQEFAMALREKLGCWGLEDLSNPQEHEP